MVLHGKDEKGSKEGTVSAVCKKAQFVCKDIVWKKTNPQQKLERYFPVAKQGNAKVEKNFQGFPMSECVYEEELDKYVFKPAGYPPAGENPTKQHALCHKCLLRPCLVKGKWDDIMGFCEDIMVFENDDSEGMYSKLTNHAESIMVEIFGAKYAAHTAAPGCVYELIGKYHNVKSGMEAEGSPHEDPDDELVANAIDGGEYLPLQSNSP
jgi:hypothetical protein